MTVLGLPRRDPFPAMDGSLMYPAEAPEAVPGLSSFLRILRSVEPEVLAGADFSPLSGLLTLCGLAAVPRAVPWDLPGSSGFRIARGPVEVDDPPIVSRPIRLSWVSPVERSSFRRRTLFPSRGWTEIFVPAGLSLRLWLVRLILFRLLRASPLSALREMPGSLRWSLRTTVRARDS